MNSRVWAQVASDLSQKQPVFCHPPCRHTASFVRAATDATVSLRYDSGHFYTIKVMLVVQMRFYQKVI